MKCLAGDRVGHEHQHILLWLGLFSHAGKVWVLVLTLDPGYSILELSFLTLCVCVCCTFRFMGKARGQPLLSLFYLSSSLLFLHFIYCVCVHACEGQKVSWGSCPSPIVEVIGINLRSLDLVGSRWLNPLSRLSGPSTLTFWVRVSPYLCSSLIWLGWLIIDFHICLSPPLQHWD